MWQRNVRPFSATAPSARSVFRTTDHRSRVLIVVLICTAISFLFLGTITVLIMAVLRQHAISSGLDVA